MATLPHSLVSFSGTTTSASDLLKSKSNFVNGIPLKAFGKTRLGTVKRDVTVVAIWKGLGKGLGKGKKKPEPSLTQDSDPNAKGGVLRRISKFQPLKEKPKPVTLNFEKPLLDLEKKIMDVRKMAEQTGLDFSEQILSLQNKYDKALKDLYTHLTPIQRVYIARHPNRPTFLDHVFNMTDKFVELHGDRAGYDDPAIVTGLGSIDGRSYMFIGQQKGRNSRESIKRNFGMPTPHGYRKALRMMKYADHHGFPIITFIDTPGAYADIKSEELGQGEAIAYNLRAMFGLRVPVVSIIIGEGGSGGALAIACGNRLLMLENAVFYVASPEACAAILFKSAAEAPKAAARLKITAPELCRMKIADGIIPEPLGGAHADPVWTSQQIKLAVTKAMDELLKMDTPKLLHDRMMKFRNVGKYSTMKPKEMALIAQKKQALTGKKPIVQRTEKLKKISEGKESSEQNYNLGKLKQEVLRLYGVQKMVKALKEDIASARANGDGDLEKELMEKIRKMEEEMKLKMVEALKSSLVDIQEATKSPPDAETKKHMETVAQQIKHKLAEVTASLAANEKDGKLRTELEEANGSSGGSDGTLKHEALRKNGSAVGINVGAKQGHN